MRFNLFQLSAVFLAGVALQSCGVDEITVPADELYARDFIKTFGIVDPDHDWTAATHTGVTVTTASPSRVKIIATHNGKRYLFADYTDVNGTRTLPFDLPKGVTDITVRVNGKDYPATPGSTVNATAASRALNEGTYEGVRTVTISELTEEPTYLTLTKEEMINVSENYLKENNSNISNITESNLGKVTDNFYAKSKSFYIFPEYWDTGHHADNKIGVYYYVPEGTEGAESVTYRTLNADGGYDEETRYIVRVKIFDGLITQLTRGTVDWTDKWFDPWNVKDIPNDWTEKIHATAVEAKLDDIFCKADGTTHADKNGNIFTEGAYLYKCSDGSYIDYQHSLALLKSDDKETKTIAAEMYGAIASMFPEELYLLGNRWENNFTDISTINYNFGAGKLTMADGNPGKAVKDEFSNYDIYHSQGVKIEFDQVTEFGFWLEQSGYSVMYSESALNEPFTTKNENGEDQTYMSSYVATFKAGFDSYGNDKRYMCFEDWNVSSGPNFDMNDMVFRVYGFDHLREELPDNPGGEIVPDPDPTPTPGTDPEAFQWIVACEDLGGTFDYDFNDVVYGVQYVAGDTHPYVYVTALAAGGTLPVELRYNNIVINGYSEGQEIIKGSVGKDGEWHSWFGSSDLNPINVGDSFNVGATVRFRHDGKFTMGLENGDDLSGFTVNVKTDEGTVTVKRPHNNGGVADQIPQMFVTTAKFTWPTEMTPIYSTHTGDSNKGDYNKEIEHQGKKYTGHHNSFLHWLENEEAAKGFHDEDAQGSVVRHNWTEIAIRISDYIKAADAE